MNANAYRDMRVRVVQKALPTTVNTHAEMECSALVKLMMMHIKATIKQATQNHMKSCIKIVYNQRSYQIPV